MKFLFFISIFFLAIASCKRPSSITSLDEKSFYSDTLLLTNSGIFFSCCKITSEVFKLKFPNKPEILHCNSSNGGSQLYKKYKIEDDLIATFTYLPLRPSRYYDPYAFDINLNCDSPKDDCIPSPTIEDATGKTSRIHCIDSNLVCNGFGNFDGKGYTYLKVEDYRPIPIPIKEAFAAEFLSNFIKRDTIFHFDSTIHGRVDTVGFDLCIGKTFGRLIAKQNANAEELFIVINKDWYNECLKLYSLANCLIEEYFQDKKFKMITLVAQQPEENNFKRLATFIIRDNTDVITKGTVRYDGSTNFVDCIWIDKTFANKLYSAEDCERWQMGR